MPRPSVPFRKLVLLFLSLSTAALISGCGVGPVTTSASGTMALQGLIHGGQQGVGFSTVSLYTAGTTGNGSAATSMLRNAVTSDANGFFSITNDYSCVNSTDQVYITATGGNPGLGAGTNNDALVLMAALGNCGNLSTLTYIYMDEVTTVAAAWALNQFIGSSVANIGASATNATGLANAFLDAQLIANSSNGLAATNASNLTIETGKLYSFADAIAPCVNSGGSASPACTALVAAATPMGGSAPAANTLAAALNIVRHPGDTHVVPATFALINSQAPFGSALTSAPHDWTMSLTVTGGGMNSPTAMGVDATGNVWVASYYGVLSGFSPQGTPFSSAGFGSGYLAECYGLTIDNNGNVWVSNQEQPSHSPGHGAVVKFGGTNSGMVGLPFYNHTNFSFYYYDSTIDFPTALATASNGNIYIANYANSSATVYTSTGGLVTSGLASNNSAFPVAIAVDSSNGVWLGNSGDSTVTHVDINGNVLARPTCCSDANGVALDSSGNAWFSNYYPAVVTNGVEAHAGIIEVSSGGIVATLPTLADGGTEGGIDGAYPSGVAVDASQNVWVADYRATAFSELAGNSNTLPAGTGISPSLGYGLDASLLLPFAIHPDTSGNLWISNQGRNSLVMFFGLATPTVSPTQPAPTAP